MLPNDCKKELERRLVQTLWRQWASLGVAAHVESETRFAVDVEALILSTLCMGQKDRRLLRSAQEWFMANSRLVSYSRLRRLGKWFNSAASEHQVPLLDTAGVRHVNQELMRHGLKSVSFLVDGQTVGAIGEAGDEADGSAADKRIRPTRWSWPSGGQLVLRELFGVNARAEVLLHLLSVGSGSSPGIARATWYDQKSVYRILESWVQAGVVRKRSGRGKNGYLLVNPDRWMGLFNTDGTSPAVDWGAAFRILCLVAGALDTAPRAGDPYLLSSLFKDVWPEVVTLSEALGLKYLDHRPLSGSDFFTPAAEHLLEVVGMLAQVT